MWTSLSVFVQCLSAAGPPSASVSSSERWSHCGCGWPPTTTLHTPHPRACLSLAQLSAQVCPWWTLTESEKRREWTASPKNFHKLSKWSHKLFLQIYTESTAIHILQLVVCFNVITPNKMFPQFSSYTNGSLSYVYVKWFIQIWRTSAIYWNGAVWVRARGKIHCCKYNLRLFTADITSFCIHRENV